MAYIVLFMMWKTSWNIPLSVADHQNVITRSSVAQFSLLTDLQTFLHC